MSSHRKYLAAIVLAAMALVGWTEARAQTTLTVSPASADVKAVPVLTWSSPTGSVCTASGAWSGSKASAGTQTLPEISATANYALSCVTPAVASKPGTATVSWTAPTTNTDGTPYTNPGGFRLMWGTSATNLGQTFYLQDPLARQWVSGSLSYGTWYFAVRSYNALGLESNTSTVVSKIVGTAPIAASTTTSSATLTVNPAPLPPVITSVVVAGVNYVPVFRVNSTGTAVSATVYGLIPVGRACGEKVSTWRGKNIHRVTVNKSELWGTTNSSNLAAPCA